MDTGRSISFTSVQQVNDRLFNYSVHLSSLEASSLSAKWPFFSTQAGQVVCRVAILDGQLQMTP